MTPSKVRASRSLRAFTTSGWWRKISTTSRNGAAMAQRRKTSWLIGNSRPIALIIAAMVAKLAEASNIRIIPIRMSSMLRNGKNNV